MAKKKAPRAVHPRLRWTTDYDLFENTPKNRTLKLNTPRRRKLFRSMEKHGFIAAYPIHCVRVNGALIIQDGQHRVAFARKLTKAVAYVICDEVISIADINNTQQPWTLVDYAESFEAQGKRAYREVLAFAKEYSLGISVAANILNSSNGVPSYNQMQAFRDGRFKVTSRDDAARIASLYNAIGALSKEVKTRFLLQALAACCRLDVFKDDRLLSGAKRVPEKLIKYGSRDGYLDMIETLYNYSRRDRIAIKMPAQEASRHRNPAARGKK